LGIQSRGEGLDDGQSQSAADSALIAVESIKSREDLLPFGIGNPGTVIFDIDHLSASSSKSLTTTLPPAAL